MLLTGDILSCKLQSDGHGAPVFAVTAGHSEPCQVSDVGGSQSRDMDQRRLALCSFPLKMNSNREDLETIDLGPVPT